MPSSPIDPPSDSPVSLMRGEGWQRCCICFELHEAPFPNLHRDAGGALWDLCAGDCAREAGMPDVECAP